jgi:energy-coupling factor transporter ATP-binding protein EcfA2
MPLHFSEAIACAGRQDRHSSTQMLAATVEQEIVFGPENLGLPPETVQQRLEETMAHLKLAPCN